MKGYKSHSQIMFEYRTVRKKTTEFTYHVLFGIRRNGLRRIER